MLDINAHNNSNELSFDMFELLWHLAKISSTVLDHVMRVVEVGKAFFLAVGLGDYVRGKADVNVGTEKYSLESAH